MIAIRRIDVTDTKRKEVLGKKEGMRKIAVLFYYPGTEAEDKKPYDLLSENNRKSLGKKADFTIFNERVRVYENLPVRQGCYPLILFSHGYGGYVEQNSDLCQYLAKHGYIVASIGHPYEANEIQYADGSTVSYDKSLTRKMFHPFLPALIDMLKMTKEKLAPQEALVRFDSHQLKYESFMITRLKAWAKDDRAVVERIMQMNEEEDSFLYHHIDFTNGIGATGHSFGGATAYYHCLYDDLVGCGVNMDGGLFGDYKEDVNHKPFMQINGIKNINVTTRCRFYHDKPVHFLLFKDMEHNGFSDMKLIVNKSNAVGKADPELVLNTLNEAHLAFFDRYLKEKDTENKSPLNINKVALQNYEIF